jgi:riboflavin kinase
MTLSITANVTSGQGLGKIFVNYPWVQNQIQEKFGFIPYSGTLNLQLDSCNAIAFQVYKQNHKGITITPVRDGCSGTCYPIRIGNIKGLIVVPQIPGYSSTQLEIIAPVNLREALALKDGDELEVFFDSKIK